MLVTSIIGNFQTFDLIFNLTAGGPANSTTVITYEIYQTAFQQFRMGLATAQSVILLIMLVVLTIISRKLVEGRTMTDIPTVQQHVAENLDHGVVGTRKSGPAGPPAGAVNDAPAGSSCSSSWRSPRS